MITTTTTIFVNASSLICKKQYGLAELSNQSVENGFCLADAGRTCCSPKDALQIRQDVEVARRHDGISQECLEIMTRARCSYCDPDFSTGHTTGFC